MANMIYEYTSRHIMHADSSCSDEAEDARLSQQESGIESMAEAPLTFCMSYLDALERYL
jgi:hypothetical protein